jgi:hypothetical protein
MRCLYPSTCQITPAYPQIVSRETPSRASVSFTLSNYDASFLPHVRFCGSQTAFLHPKHPSNIKRTANSRGINLSFCPRRSPTALQLQSIQAPRNRSLLSLLAVVFQLSIIASRHNGAPSACPSSSSSSNAHSSTSSTARVLYPSIAGFDVDAVHC